jgi:predicted nucleotidyltransferase component of viral defense system
MLSIEQILSFYPEGMRKFRGNILREYLQYKILEAVFGTPYAPRLSLMGGTCIHLVHGSPRFSGDLDFDNDALTALEFRKLASLVEKELRLEGYTVELETTERGAFHGYYRFPSLLHESGLTGHRTQKLLIQLDTEPQGFS